MWVFLQVFDYKCEIIKYFAVIFLFQTILMLVNEGYGDLNHQNVKSW